jgi:hypothetical protein
MENMSHRATAPTPLTSLARLAIALLALGCASCGPQLIEGRPPFIGIASMSLQNDVLSTDFRIANQNSVAMNIQAAEITVTVDGATLTREQGQRQLAIDANSSEELRVERPADDSTRRLLGALERREVQSLSFELTGRVLTQEDGYLRFEHKGHFYPVPGRPGYFRSAVTQADQLRREDPL